MAESPPKPASLAERKSAGGWWGIDEFVDVVNALIERYLPATRSPNVKLRDAFNPRLVRYYATFGLISPPERAGKEARYHYGHLLQALVIRRLLFEGYTAPVLLKMLAGKTEADYEAMLTGGISTAAAYAPRDEAEGHRSTAEPSEHQRLVRDLMAALPASRVARGATPPPPIPASAPPALIWREDAASLPTPAGHCWRRIEVAPGLELHVRDDFAPPATSAQREKLLLAMLDASGARRKP